MSDPIDKANELAQQQLIDQIKQVTERKKGIARFHCEDCEKAIPQARRIASPDCIRCVDCQSFFESKQQHYR
ncbi:TraR/DksA family transcriptional regulator [Arsenophonus nasoniae]|uniref:TraR/DksA family transcriptional regulator n=1 Tax=Arsenophonus nasoniae TaxID=638 RepID=A0AA95KFK8_9GAMM|nr:TraR/DksA family transcriptional regulator [Arsenophonus nasoniae]WGM03984.1 TraR/DksA family transcriptional regulator [Arsenophonus nasoniae]